MSESLRNDGRIWVPAKLEDAKAIREGKKKPTELSEEDRDYYLERRYPSFGISFLVMLLLVLQRKK
jgi:succinate dehydrogenase / fumarate reductase flavoprotein subunit